MLSLPHLIIVFVVALVVFGPEKLPELARNVGKFMAEFRRMTGEFKSTFEGHMRELEREADERRRTPPPVTTPPNIAPPPAAAATPAPPAQAAEQAAEGEENSIRGPAPQADANAAAEASTPAVTPAQGIVPSADPRVPVQHEPATEASNGSHGSHEASAISAEEPGETPEPVTDGQHHSS
ncbi:MAG TPA: twin-arginine translocase TatA/TatE family subunit [Candidatus Aquilonibacter sp.]|nr:twin-arginine translocase TatA/TatE family subunit [Candidatus Aquilonibacter sp.]